MRNLRETRPLSKRNTHIWCMGVVGQALYYVDPVYARFTRNGRESQYAQRAEKKEAQCIRLRHSYWCQHHELVGIEAWGIGKRPCVCWRYQGSNAKIKSVPRVYPESRVKRKKTEERRGGTLVIKVLAGGINKTTEKVEVPPTWKQRYIEITLTHAYRQIQRELGNRISQAGPYQSLKGIRINPSAVAKVKGRVTRRL